MQRLSLCFFLLLAVMCAKGQCIMSVPLKQGGNDTEIQLEDITVKVVNLIVRFNQDNVGIKDIQLEMKIQEQNEDYQVFLFWVNSQQQNNFPIAIGKYLFSLYVYKDSVNLVIDTLKMGNTFILERKLGRSVKIGELRITYEFGVSGSFIAPIDLHYDGYEISDILKLSENGEEEVVTFEYDSTKPQKDNILENKWKGYKIEVLDNLNAPLRIRVTKEITVDKQHTVQRSTLPNVKKQFRPVKTIKDMN